MALVPLGPPVLWRDLRRFTPARLALGRAGNGLPTQAHLAFQAAHAAARDAVHAELDTEALAADLAATNLSSFLVQSACPDRRTYLLRPDLGRRLAENQSLPPCPPSVPTDIAFVICDGLSATAAQHHAAPLLAEVMPALGQSGPVVIARQGRVALGDAIGAAMGAQAVVVLIGERPGLSSPDSLGAYLTWNPRPGRTDAERNCISNIRSEGLAIPDGGEKLLWLIAAMRRLRLTGIGLKDEQPGRLETGQKTSTSVIDT